MWSWCAPAVVAFSLSCTATTSPTTSGWGKCTTWPITSSSSCPMEPGKACVRACAGSVYCDHVTVCWIAWTYVDRCHIQWMSRLAPSRCSMSVEDGAKLYDVCPHVSDSVRSHRLWSVTSGTFALFVCCPGCCSEVIAPTEAEIFCVCEIVKIKFEHALIMLSLSTCAAPVFVFYFFWCSLLFEDQSSASGVQEPVLWSRILGLVDNFRFNPGLTLTRRCRRSKPLCGGLCLR